jgi:hypothetical protein
MLSWDINWLAVVVAVVAYQFIGFLWYGPLFGKPWRAAMGVPEGDMQNPGPALAVGLLSSIIFAISLALLLTLGDDPDVELGITIGAIAGLIIAAASVMHAAYESKNQTVLWVGASYQLVGMIVMGAILGAMQ